jgi:hypothetical protein
MRMCMCFLPGYELVGQRLHQPRSLGPLCAKELAGGWVMPEATSYSGHIVLARRMLHTYVEKQEI